MINPIHLAPGLLFVPATWVTPERRDRACEGRQIQREYDDLKHYAPVFRAAAAERPSTPSAMARAVRRLISWVTPAPGDAARPRVALARLGKGKV